MRKRIILIGAAVVVAMAGTVAAVSVHDRTAPSAPKALTATATTLTSVRLEWARSTDNIGVAEYDVYQTLNGRTTHVSGTTTSLINDLYGLKANTRYTFFVKAVDAAGNQSKPSAVAVVTTQQAWQNCSAGYVALTFDDGPTPSSIALAATLERYGVRATFFDVGEHVAATRPGRGRSTRAA
jgi:Fibronectin type III domain/Polysaccharide deacetylase